MISPYPLHYHVQFMPQAEMENRFHKLSLQVLLGVIVECKNAPQGWGLPYD